MTAFCNLNYFCCIEITANFVSIIGVVVGAAGLIFATWQYRKSNEIKRAEFCTRIFDSLFKEDTYWEIREILDPVGGFTIEYEKSLLDKFNDPNNIRDQIQLTNYLNFFEYILILEKMKVIGNSDIKNLFEYYLKVISKSTFINEYTKKYGFEHLVSKFDQLNNDVK